MIEEKVTKKFKTIVKLNDDSVYLLNIVKNIFQDRPAETFVDDYNKMNEKG